MRQKFQKAADAAIHKSRSYATDMVMFVLILAQNRMKMSHFAS
jgi:hypothetical protein